jgi:hypothetical protein
MGMKPPYSSAASPSAVELSPYVTCEDAYVAIVELATLPVVLSSYDGIISPVEDDRQATISKKTVSDRPGDSQRRSDRFFPVPATEREYFTIVLGVQQLRRHASQGNAYRRRRR